VTDVCRTGLLLEEIGSPHPPEMSLGVMRDGTFPNSTLGAAAFADTTSGAPQGLLSLPEPHGSNTDELLWGGIGGIVGCVIDLGAATGADGGCEDRLKGELKVVLLMADEITWGAGAGAGAGLGGEVGVELAKPPKSSAANRSTGIDVAVGLGAGAAAGFGGGAL